MTRPLVDAGKPVLVDIARQGATDSAQGQNLTPVVYSDTAPVENLSVGRVHMAGGHTARAHVHNHSEIIIIVLDGTAATLWGPEMSPITHGPGEMLWIPQGCPHTAVNVSLTDKIVAIEVRSDPTFNDDVELLPELEPLVAARVEELHSEQRRLAALAASGVAR